MFNKPMIRSILVACAALLALGIGVQLVKGSAQAQPQINPSIASSEQSLGITIPYSGYLRNAIGKPVSDGNYDFTFNLYSMETGGSKLWLETQTEVRVQAGAFQVLLGSVQTIPTEVMDVNPRWLEVAVRGPGETTYTTLAPRQLIADIASTASNSPSAAPSCPHDHLSEVWSANIGWSSAGLRINNSANGPALWGYNSGGGNGVRGESSSNLGVYGWSDSNDAIQGRSVQRNGVAGYSEAPDVWAGVYGEAPHYGVFGRATSSGWWGVYSDGDLGTTGDLWVGGNSQVDGSKSASVPTDQGKRLLYSEESTQVWFSDYGFGTLQNGVAVIVIDPLFSQTVNLKKPYHVFLQVYGNAELYVTNRTATQFIVHLREGDPNVEFSYRIVAMRLGYEDDRLEPAAMSEYDKSLLNPGQ